MGDKLEKPYNPADTENRIYTAWEEGDKFRPENGPNTSGKRFSMVLPPPNVTGVLHTGHAAMLAIQDILTRYHRMKGDNTLWLPGTDHAAIATQARVEKDLYKTEKKTRHDLGREEFLKRVEKFAKESHDTIATQIRKMGASVDWSREAYTLDEKRNLAVYTAFKKMYDAGLIYRGNRIVNWDTKLQTTVSDDEVEYKEVKDKLYTFKYSKDFPISISSTRPETKLGDTAVAVHPSDKRYKDYIDRTFDVSFCGTELKIKIVADESVDKEFGTGAVGITPAHSFTDFDIAQRHDLPTVQVINEYGKMMTGGDNVKDKKTNIAREEVVAWLKKEKLLENEEVIVHNVATSDRSGATIEPLPKLQWFVDVNKKFKLPHSNIDGIKKGEEVSLKQLMHTVLESGQIKIIPDRFKKTYFHWTLNLRDWCISRQLWFGHQIPVWYHEEKCIPKKGREKEVAKCEEIIISDTEPKCKHCDAKFIRDPDTLDTWFSSGLWTFSTLGWPENTKDLKTFHPTDVLETGYDILFFWIARMILMTGFLLGDIPFHTVYLHGMVRDEKGRKMSKSLDNIIDPVTLINKYGADALRFELTVGTPPGNDLNLSEPRIKGYKHFANKIWNVSRFVLTNTKDVDLGTEPKLLPQDKAYLNELATLVKDVTDEIEKYNLYLASEKLYHYFWHTFADKIIEETKERLYNGTSEEKLSAQWILHEIITTTLKLIHPFMPFVTEEIWSMVSWKEKMLIHSAWPKAE